MGRSRLRQLSVSGGSALVHGSRQPGALDAEKGTLRVTTFACEPLVDVQPQALGLTYWFDADTDGEPYAVAIRFTGRRIGVKGKPRPHDSFDITETIEHVMPGSGRVSFTVRISDVAPGEWHVTATPAGRAFSQMGTTMTSVRTPRLPRASSSGVTSYAPVVQIRAPGARLGAWPGLVGLGVLAALASQVLLARHSGLHVTSVLGVSLVASVVGLVGAKAYYVTGHYLARRFLPGHREDPTTAVLSAGMCIQGFVAGALITLVAGGFVVGLPVGRLLDMTAPGLFIGMTIGRFGCFFGGCCAGRPTASRWGLWSSDRRLGMRRVPTQLLESALAVSIGLPALLAAWTTTPQPAGVLFVGTVAAYTFGRQLLLPLRDNPRKTSQGRNLTTALAAIAASASVIVALLI